VQDEYGIGSCIDGEEPCSEDEVCIESRDVCWSKIQLTAQTMQKRLWRPFFRARRCLWLMLGCRGEDHVDPLKSTVSLSCLESGEAAGVSINQERQIRKTGRTIMVPLCIERDATQGQWQLLITTDHEEGDNPFQEVVKVQFEVQ